MNCSALPNRPRMTPATIVLPNRSFSRTTFALIRFGFSEGASLSPMEHEAPRGPPPTSLRSLRELRAVR
jgi:hypothetical protein